MKSEQQEKVIADYAGIADIMLKVYGDKAWLIAIERITNEEGGKAFYVPFWRGVLKALDLAKE